MYVQVPSTRFTLCTLYTLGKLDWTWGIRGSFVSWILSMHQLIAVVFLFCERANEQTPHYTFRYNLQPNIY